MKKTYFIHLVSPYCKNIDVEVRGAKKVYFCDNNYIAKPQEGALLENGVFNQLKNYGELNCYQKYTGVEIDFVLDKKVVIEVKTATTQQEIKKLRKIVSFLGIKEYFIVSKKFLQHPRVILSTDI